PPSERSAAGPDGPAGERRAADRAGALLAPGDLVGGRPWQDRGSPRASAGAARAEPRPLQRRARFASLATPCTARGGGGARAGQLDPVGWRIDELLALDDHELIDAVGGKAASKLKSTLGDFDAGPLRESVERAGLETICRCDPAFPGGLAALPRPPSALYVAGGR